MQNNSMSIYQYCSQYCGLKHEQIVELTRLHSVPVKFMTVELLMRLSEITGRGLLSHVTEISAIITRQQSK